jgi:endonuclease III related protein
MSTTSPTASKRTRAAYDILLKAYGPRHWWPADTPFEVCVGAILTQSTSWSNVERAIGNLKEEKLLSPAAIAQVRPGRLARLIRPSLYYNVKARKLKEFVRFLRAEYGGRVGNMKATPTAELREKLLGVWGLGPESVDSILLYAIGKPSFVADAYTRRIFFRLGLTGENATYDELKNYFEANLPNRVRHYNEFHALIVEHGKRACKTKPLCGSCCLKRMCPMAHGHTG